ncbi:MAG: hypothetical protein H6644_15565 [Caldilineaceae bacterium]|nr:hypothetical protein [Caldilineaceae bacterium]
MVDGAVIRQIERGSIYTLNSPLEIELAEELVATIPSAEMVRYTKGGGEACAVAVRIARSVTGRDKGAHLRLPRLARLVPGRQLRRGPESGEFPLRALRPIGVPAPLAGTVIPFTYGNLEMLAALLDEHGDDVAAIMMEPARSTCRPQATWTVCRRWRGNTAWSSFSTRCRAAGAIASAASRKAVGVTPDMTVVAKAMSTQLPHGSGGGVARGDGAGAAHVHSSSYWSDNIGLGAALTTIREVEAAARRTASGPSANDCAPRSTRPLPGQAGGSHGRPPQRADAAPRSAGRVAAAQSQHALHSGDGAPRRPLPDVVSRHAGPHRRRHRPHRRGAHEACRVIKRGLEHDELDTLLLCDVRREPFRRLVR